MEVQGPQVKYWIPTPQGIPSLGNCAFKGQFLSISLCLKRRVPPSSHPGTSGDTGSAAIESVQGVKNVDIIVLLPKGHCTKIQELQMTTVLRENVHVFGGECWD